MTKLGRMTTLNKNKLSYSFEMNKSKIIRLNWILNKIKGWNS